MATTPLERFVITRCEEHFGAPIEHVTWQEREAWIKQVARTFDGSPDTSMAEALAAVLVKPPRAHIGASSGPANSTEQGQQ